MLRTLTRRRERPALSHSRRGQRRRSTALLLGLYWLALSIGTHVPSTGLGSAAGSDKFLHFFAYFGLGLLLCLAIASYRPLTWRWLLGAWLLLVGYGVLDELLQIPVPGRVGDVWDWVADSLGATAGVALFGWGHRRLRRSREKPHDDQEALDQRRAAGP